MLQIAICDDEPIFAQGIQRYVERFLAQEKTRARVEVFFNGQALCTKLEQGTRYDILFLDIGMEGINGIEVGRRLRTHFQGRDTLLFYVSSHDERAKELFELNTFRFIDKPIDCQKLFTQLSSAFDYLRVGRGSLFQFKQAKGDLMEIPYRSILYFESSGRMVTVIAEDERYQYYGKLKDLYDELAAKDFICVHRSFLVNFDHIRELRFNEVLLSNDETILISNSKRRETRQRYFDIGRKRWY